MPDTHIRDFRVRTELDGKYEDAILKVEAILQSGANLPAPERKGGKAGTSADYVLEAKLLDAVGRPAIAEPVAVTFKNQPGGDVTVTLETEVDSPAKWNAENPALYTLLLTLKDRKGKVIEVIPARTGTGGRRACTGFSTASNRSTAGRSPRRPSGSLSDRASRRRSSIRRLYATLCTPSTARVTS